MNYLLFLLPIITALAVTFQRCAELGTKRDVVTGHVYERATLRLFVVNGFAVLLFAILEYILQGKGLVLITYIAGIACALLSLMIRKRAIAALGRFWSLHVEIREQHKLVTDGPFRFVRHPTYLSMFLELLAIGLILNSYYALLFSVIIFIPTLIVRIRMEEKALISKFGDSYRDYIKTTPALVPWKIRRN